MFFSIKKKHSRLFLLILSFVTGFSLYLLSTKSTIVGTSTSYFDVLTRNLQDRQQLMNSPSKSLQVYVDPEVYVNKRVKNLYYKKIVNDLDDKYWLIDNKLYQSSLKIPSYFKKSSKSKIPIDKPPIQPFDPRFTLGMYFYYLEQQFKKSSNVTIPFHWYDWKDMSILNRHLLAPEHQQLDCSFLNSIPNENVLLDEEDRKEEEKNKVLKKLEDERLEKERKKAHEEEENKKKVEEALKQKQHLHEQALRKQMKEELQENLKLEFEEKLSSLQTELIENKNNPEKLANIIESIEALNVANSKSKQELENQYPIKEKNNPKKINEENKIEAEKVEEKKNEEKKEENKEKNELDNQNGKREIIDDPEIFKRQKSNRKNEALPVNQFCLNNSEVPHDFQDGNKVRPGFNVFQAPGKTTEDRSILIGTSYLYFAAPSPEQVLFLTKEGSYRVGTSARSKLLDNGIVEDYIKTTGSDKIDVSKQFQKLQKSHKPKNENLISDFEVKLPPESFIFNHVNITNDFESRIWNEDPLTQMELNYYKSLKASQFAVQNKSVTKYFHESRIIGSTLGDHYDWRFTNGIQYGAYEQTLVLHRLVRTWLSFCRKQGINTWVAHGSLLSWYWNGMAFPWDEDIDVQVPIMDLHKLAMNFNQTLVVEDAEDGYGRYFVDCGTFITLREKGNGLNNIDARFIDVDTGLYIDITGLAVSNTGAPNSYKEKYLPKGWIEKEHNRTNTNLHLKAYNCRNNHFYLHSELSPLIKTIVEGEVGYIPKKFTEILTTEYSHGLKTKIFKNHVFIPQLRLWIPHDDIYLFLQDRDKWNEVSKFSEMYKEAEDEEEKFNLKYKINEEETRAFRKINSGIGEKDLDTIFDLTPDDILDFLNKDDIFISFFTTYEFTQFHEEEIMRLVYSKPTSKLIDSAPDFAPMKYEPFMYKLHTDYLTFEKSVERYSNLIDFYRNE